MQIKRKLVIASGTHSLLTRRPRQPQWPRWEIVSEFAGPLTTSDHLIAAVCVRSLSKFLLFFFLSHPACHLRTCTLCVAVCRRFCVFLCLLPCLPVTDYISLLLLRRCYNIHTAMRMQ